MDDEERKKLCEYLRFPTGRHDADILDKLCKEAANAADEIERLADVSRLIDRWRKKADECYTAYKETSDPAEGAASDVYSECANNLAADRSTK